MREIVSVTKTYRFSAGHRLYIKGLSDEENFRLFDNCSNPNGHGHDYYLDVRVGGEIDPETGMILNPAELDEAVVSVIDDLDYRRLDIEVPHFRERQATGENIAEYIWERLEPRLKGMLVHLRLSETENSYFEYFKEDDHRHER